MITFPAWLLEQIDTKQIYCVVYFVTKILLHEKYTSYNAICMHVRRIYPIKNICNT